jgi:hypothetical protein
MGSCLLLVPAGCETPIKSLSLKPISEPNPKKGPFLSKSATNERGLNWFFFRTLALRSSKQLEWMQLDDLTFSCANYVRETILLPFFCRQFSSEIVLLLGLYPKLSLNNRDILNCSHTVGAI